MTEPADIDDYTGDAADDEAVAEILPPATDPAKVPADQGDAGADQ